MGVLLGTTVGMISCLGLIRAGEVHGVRRSKRGKLFITMITFGLNEEEAKMVLGGEVALWSEQSDGTFMDGRIWPRGSAITDLRWSGNRERWRHRMVGRGIGAEPIHVSRILACVVRLMHLNTFQSR